LSDRLFETTRVLKQGMDSVSKSRQEIMNSEGRRATRD
jgi:hypothetical protein